MSGYVKINRAVLEHWIFKDAWKFRCWIDLISLANYTEQKIEISGILFTCKRGESLRSLETLAKRWGCDKSKVRRFLKLLEKDNMIVLKNELKTTRITICKYDDYQSDENADATQTKRKRNANATQTDPNNKDKKDNKEKKVEFQQRITPFVEQYGRAMCNEFYQYWTETTKDNKLRWEKETAFDVSRRLSNWQRNGLKFKSDESSVSGDELINNVMAKIGKK
jgi:DNA-binding transcriptional regulator YhcF (GntR family)